MNSWSETCFMSNLPIKHGDDVYLFILAPTSRLNDAGEACDPDDRYVPLGFPILGKYDEYGNVKDAYLGDYMMKYLCEFAPIYIKHWDPKIGAEIYDRYNIVSFDEFILDLTQRNLYVELYKHKRLLSYATVHAELYQRLLDEITNRIPLNHNNNYCVLLEDKIRNAFTRCELDRDKKFQEGYNGDRCCKFSEYCKDLHHPNWKIIDSLADEYFITHDENIIKNIVDYLLWKTVMTLSRRGYHCYIGANEDQKNEYRLQQIIAEYVLEKCQQRERNANSTKLDPLAETIFFYDDNSDSI